MVTSVGEPAGELLGGGLGYMGEPVGVFVGELVVGELLKILTGELVGDLGLVGAREEGFVVWVLGELV